jgi:hypothetical protein
MIDMFKRMRESRKAMEERIKELEAMKESMYKVMEKQADQICKLREEKNYWQERYDEYVDYVEEQKEVMEDYLYVLKEKLEEAEGAEEYIAELEEELFKENPNHVLVRGMAQYFGERDAIDAVCRVKEEPLLLEAPVAEVKYHIAIERGLDMVSDVDEVIFLRELMSEPDEVSKQAEIDAKIRRMKAKMRKPQIKKDEHSGRVAGRPPVPPKPIKKVC